MNIHLKTMTKELARQYFRQFELDPDLFADKKQYQPYIYSDEKSDATVERYQKLGRIYLAIMLGEEPIGEVILKNIDQEQKHCTLGICMRSDVYKNKGYGTEAEMQTLQYAFCELGMETVFADALLDNKRSQHVLEKVGFRKTRQDDTFVYYQCTSADCASANQVKPA